MKKLINTARKAIKDCQDLNIANDCLAMLKKALDKYGIKNSKTPQLSVEQQNDFRNALREIMLRCGKNTTDRSRANSMTVNELVINDYFQDYAVLQHGKSIPITGKTRPDTVIHAQLGNYEAWGHSDNTGSFEFRLPPMPPLEDMTLSISAGRLRRTFRHIAVGDVYLLGGQSNMEFKLQFNIPGIDKLDDNAFNGIRFLQIPQRTYHGQRHDLGGARWQISTREKAECISALGFFFARIVRQNENVVVGLVDTSVGGAAAETFVSRSSLLTVPELREELLEYDKFASCKAEARLLNPPPKLLKNVRKLFPEVPHDIGLDLHYESTALNDREWECMTLPDNWTQAGHNHAGIFWFRKTIEIDECMPDEKWELHLGAVDKADITFINGKKVGAMCSAVRFEWNLQRVYNVPKGLLHRGRNLLAVQASNMMSTLEDGGLIGPEEEMYLLRKATGEKIPLYGEWRYKETYDAGTIGMTFMRTLGAGATESMHILYDNMIVPLAGIPFAAVLFYQGEANAICCASFYATLLSLMIDDWRHILENRELPFVIFQLPEIGRACPYGAYSQWALLREAQAQVCSRTENTKCVVTLGTSDGREIHPVNKLPLAESAFAMLHRNQTAPELKEIAFSGKYVTILFDGEPLDVNTPPEGFVLAASDTAKPVLAKAEYLSEHSIRVSAKGIAKPSAIWYAWSDNPSTASLRGKNGLRVSPFRKML